MPVGQSGVTSEYAYTISNLSNGYVPYQYSAPGEVAEFPIIANQPLTTAITGAFQNIVAVGLHPCLPGHFTAAHAGTTVYAWEQLQLGSVGDTARFANIQFLGSPGTLSTNWETDIYVPAWIDDYIRAGSYQGGRDASLRITSAATTYSEYIPDVVGGAYLPATVFYPDIQSPVTVDADGILTIPPGWHYISPPGGGGEWSGWVDSDSLYSLDGVTYERGCVFRIEVVDYILDPDFVPQQDGAKPPSVDILTSYWGSSRGVTGDTAIYCTPTAEKYGLVSYTVAPFEFEAPHIRFIVDGLLQCRVKIEMYSSMDPPTPKMFWGRFVQAIEVVGDGAPPPGPSPDPIEGYVDFVLTAGSASAWGVVFVGYGHNWEEAYGTPMDDFGAIDPSVLAIGAQAIELYDMSVITTGESAGELYVTLAGDYPVTNASVVVGDISIPLEVSVAQGGTGLYGQAPPDLFAVGQSYNIRLYL